MPLCPDRLAAPPRSRRRTTHTQPASAAPSQYDHGRIVDGGRGAGTARHVHGSYDPLLNTWIREPASLAEEAFARGAPERRWREHGELERRRKGAVAAAAASTHDLIQHCGTKARLSAAADPPRPHSAAAGGAHRAAPQGVYDPIRCACMSSECCALTDARNALGRRCGVFCCMRRTNARTAIDSSAAYRRVRTGHDQVMSGRRLSRGSSSSAGIAGRRCRATGSTWTGTARCACSAKRPWRRRRVESSTAARAELGRLRRRCASFFLLTTGSRIDGQAGM